VVVFQEQQSNGFWTRTISILVVVFQEQK
jgi:hypothetical protein